MNQDIKIIAWRELASKRIKNILKQHTVARMRTLEQKICDAGPFNQRPEPHHLNSAMQIMVDSGIVKKLYDPKGPWFFLAGSPEHILKERRDLQSPIVERFNQAVVSSRIGQYLEIAIFKALQNQGEMVHFGDFPNLSCPGRNGIYQKEEPPSHLSGKRIPKQKKLDFIIAGPIKAAIEA